MKYLLISGDIRNPNQGDKFRHIEANQTMKTFALYLNNTPELVLTNLEVLKEIATSLSSKTIEARIEEVDPTTDLGYCYGKMTKTPFRIKFTDLINGKEIQC